MTPGPKPPEGNKRPGGYSRQYGTYIDTHTHTHTHKYVRTFVVELVQTGMILTQTTPGSCEEYPTQIQHNRPVIVRVKTSEAEPNITGGPAGHFLCIFLRWPSSQSDSYRYEKNGQPTFFYSVKSRVLPSSFAADTNMHA